MLCPGRTGYRGTEGFNFYPNEPLLFGSLTHHVIENRLQGIDQPFSALEDELFSLFIKDMPDKGKFVSLGKLTSKTQRQNMVKGARQAADEWETQVSPHLPKSDPVIEERMTAVAGIDQGYEVVVGGTPDAIYPEDEVIVDWKTAGRMWDAKKVEGQIQPVAYPWLANENDIVVSKFVFWVYDRSSGMWGEFKVGPEHVNHEKRIGAFRMTAVNAAISIEKGIWTWSPLGQGYTTRGWHCSPKYCDAWEPCWGKHLIQDGKADLPAVKLKEKFE